MLAKANLKLEFILSGNSYLFKQAPRWHQHDFGAQRHLAPQLQSWLQETGSLTKRLRQIHAEKFAVKLLFEGWHHAYIDEALILEQPRSQFLWVREVLLHSNNQGLVLARTVLPKTTIATAQRKLSHLGSRPLGEVIFAYPDLKLCQRQFCKINQASWSKAGLAAIEPDAEIWGRRTVYAIHSQPLLVAEFFLPNSYA